MAKRVNESSRKPNVAMTSELRGEASHGKRPAHALRFVIQKHDARRLHYDFRLEMDGTLRSWVIPQGPSLDPKHKRLAIQAEDHPLAHVDFEGHISEGHDDAGEVIVWDQGIWQPEGNARESYEAGKLTFTLVGEKLSGSWTLMRTRLRGSGDKEQWLLIKGRDGSARSVEEYDIVEALPESVLSDAVITSKKVTATISSPKKSVTKPDTVKKTTIRASRPTRITHKQFVLPQTLSPELATLVTEPPPGEWLYEIKFDGYRILTRVANGKVQLLTRNGQDWTERLPLQAKAIAALELQDSWLDGEVVVLSDEGVADFPALQRAFETGRSHNIQYYLFDAPFLNGIDLRDMPVEARRAALEKVLPNQRRSTLRFSSAFTADQHNIIESACAMSLEGVIGKRMGSPYVSRRSPDWIKLKCRLRQEFIILGFTRPQGGRNAFGALLLGVYTDTTKRELLYAGRVGTGFSETNLDELHKQLTKIERATSPLANPLRGTQARGVQWVEPTLVCETEFTEWTAGGALRQAIFIALRSDKQAIDIIREYSNGPAMTADIAPSRRKNTRVDIGNKVAGITITHPDRIIDPESGSVKKDIALFYRDIAPWLLPQLNNRPVSLLRSPEGLAGEPFFQQHSEHLAIPHIKQLDPGLDPDHARLMEIDTVQALVGAVQMGTLELHTRGATSDHIDSPDRIILDLDPDPALPWRSVVEATRLTLAVLDELNLDAYLKTTGGKGMHVIIPLARTIKWETAKEFAKAIAQFMTRQIPDRFVVKTGTKSRMGKVFIDYLRNQRGATTIAAYSIRARAGLPVSVPITRDELVTLSASGQWHIGNVQQRLDQLKKDPWAGYEHRQRITQVMWKKLGAVDPAR